MSLTDMEILAKDYETYVEESLPKDPFVVLQHCLIQLQVWRDLYREEGDVE